MDTYPAGWTDAQTLAVQQSSCGADPLTSPPSPGLVLTEAGGILIAVYTDAEFRCGEQPVCGYVQDVGETTRVLIQPCDLRPIQVARCDCLYQITFTLPRRANRTAVELYHRWDLYGSSADVPATLVDTRRVGGNSGTPY